METAPLGYKTACRVLAAGRAAFFGGTNVDLPMRRSDILRIDDLTPQFGYVGARYPDTRVLLLGINPGNGRETLEKTATDQRSMPSKIRFVENPSPRAFIEAEADYKSECESWHIWKRHCKEIIGAGKLSFEEIAFSNCLPWRSAKNGAFAHSVAVQAAKLYAYPLVEELQPSLIIALGKRAAAILRLSGKVLPRLITWNRARAATQAVLRERAAAASEIFTILGRRP